MELGKVLRIC